MPRFLRREAGAEVDRLYRRHSAEVLRYAMLVLRSRTDAEDVTQTVFMRALRAIERGEKVRTPRNWLIKITHNECRRLLAGRKVHAELPDEIAVEPIERGRAEELKLAMAALPATQRQALVLRELEGRSYLEISQSLDLSVSAVETLIFRARRALREQIENAMSCEEFAALLEEPSARSRVRAHARVCADCATLDHQARGRRSALKRIASALGLPWWGAKLGAVAVATATVATAVAVVPHDATRPSPQGNPIAPARHVTPPEPSAGGTRFTGAGSKAAPGQLRPRVVAAPMEGIHPSLAAPPPAVAPPALAPGAQPAVTTPPPPLPDPPKPGEPPLPPAAAVPAVPAVPALPAVTVPQIVVPPVVEQPTVTVPTVSVPLPPPALPAVTVPVETPNVSLP